MIPTEIAGIYFTNVERHIISILGDGQPHEVADLITWDKMADESGLRNLISKIRQKIYFSRFRIHCGAEHGKNVYRLVTLYSPVSA